MKTQYRNKNPPDLISIREPEYKLYVDNINNDPSIKKTLHMLTSMIKIFIMFDLLKQTLCRQFENTQQLKIMLVQLYLTV